MDEDYYDEEYYEYFGYETTFANPGSNSALRAASASNPRDCTCPTCGAENVLTREDQSLGYQCDSCADKAERGYDY